MSALNKIWSLKKLDAYARWRLVSLLLISILCGLVIGSSYFIYSYVYRTLDDAHTIIILNSSYSINSINLENYKKATRALLLKEAAQSVPKDLRNIFTYVSEASSTPVTSTKK